MVPRGPWVDSGARRNGSICTSLPSSLSSAWSGVRKPRHLRGVRLWPSTISCSSASPSASRSRSRGRSRRNRPFSTTPICQDAYAEPARAWSISPDRADCATVGGPGSTVGGRGGLDPDRRRPMPPAYSADPPERALAACEGSQSEIARAYRVGASARSRAGPSSPARRGREGAGGRRGRDAGRLGRGAERRHPGRVRRPAGRARRGRARPLGLVPGAAGARPGAEEKTLRAAERDREDVAEAWRDELAAGDPGRLVLVDGTGIDTRMTRAAGRRPGPAGAPGAADRPRRARALQPDRRQERSRRDRHGRVPGLRRAGARAGPAGAARRARGGGRPRRPRVRGGAPDRAGPARRHLPSYPPDLNPIGPAWSKLRTRLRAAGARSREALESALGPALATITARDARGWFRLCGYAPAD